MRWTCLSWIAKVNLQFFSVGTETLWGRVKILWVTLSIYILLIFSPLYSGNLTLHFQSLVQLDSSPSWKCKFHCVLNETITARADDKGCMSLDAVLNHHICCHATSMQSHLKYIKKETLTALFCSLTTLFLSSFLADWIIWTSKENSPCTAVQATGWGKGLFPTTQLLCLMALSDISFAHFNAKGTSWTIHVGGEATDAELKLLANDILQDIPYQLNWRYT